jgi:putative exosortase-associated protein (TIGR04073 family)
MRFVNKYLLAVIVAFVMFASVDSYAGDPIRKLGRGISNVLCGALEIPIKIYDVNREEGGIAALTYGTLKGVSYFVAREVVGVVEIVTFPVPLPGATDHSRDEGWGYGPLMEPEWVVDLEHNMFNIVYDKTAQQ